MKRLLVLLLGLLFVCWSGVMPAPVHAQQTKNDDVIVNGTLYFTPEQVEAIKTKTTVTADPTEQIPGESSLITITVIGEGDLPLPGQRVQIDISGCNNYTITTPDLTDANGQTTAILTANEECTALIQVTVITIPDQPIPVDDTATVIFAYPTNVYIVMEPEPQFTGGTQNTVYWHMNDAPESNYQYYVEISTDPNFNTVLGNSGWINQTQYTFTNLQSGTTYYYRVRYRDLNGVEGPNWSNVENSTQDAVPPVSTIITVTPEPDYQVTLTFESNDDLSGVNQIIIYVSADDGPVVQLGIFPPNTLTTTIDLKKFFSNLQDIKKLTFYIIGIDNVGNKELLREGPVLFINNEASATPTPTPTPPISDQTLENNANRINNVVFAASGIITLGALLGSLPYLLIFLQNLILSGFNLPSLFVYSKEWGFVYNSITKAPVSRAILRLYSSDGQKLIRTAITDVKGIFSFKVEEGAYVLQVIKNGFTFPSRIVVGRNDPPWKNIYHGEIIKVHRQAELNLAIPVDPQEKKVALVWFRRIGTGIWSLLIRWQPVIMFLGFAYAVWTLVTFGGILNLLIIILYLILFGIRLYQFSTREPAYGLIETPDRKPLANVPIGLFEAEFDQLVNRVYSDEHGRYRFITLNQPYTLRVMDPTYRIVNVPKNQPVQNELKINAHRSKRELVVNIPVVVAPTPPSEKPDQQSWPRYPGSTPSSGNKTAPPAP